MDAGSLAIVVGLSALPLVIIGVMIAFTIRQYSREKNLEKRLSLQGTAVPGQIVKHRVHEMRRGCSYYLTYRYTFEGKEHLYEQAVNVEGFNRVRDGEEVKILVLTENPSIPRLAPVDRFRLQLI